MTDCNAIAVRVTALADRHDCLHCLRRDAKLDTLKKLQIDAQLAVVKSKRDFHQLLERQIATWLGEVREMRWLRSPSSFSIFTTPVFFWKARIALGCLLPSSKGGLS